MKTFTSNRHAHYHSAFTIIELLVVIAIISLLVAILLPSLAAARDRARYVKWKAFSHGLRTDTDNVLYYNMEEQDGTQTKAAQSNASLSVGELWNRAAGDPMIQAKVAVESEDYNGEFAWALGSATQGQKDIASPSWTFTDARWKGKGGLEFNPVGDRQHVVAAGFEAAEGVTGSSFNTFSVAWWYYPTNNGADAQMGATSLASPSPSATPNLLNWSGAPGGTHGRWLFLNSNAGDPANIRCGVYSSAPDRLDASAKTAENDWNFFAYTRQFREGGANNTHAIYHNAEEGARATPSANGLTTENWEGWAIGDPGGSGGQSLEGVLDELTFFKRELDVDLIMAMFNAGKPRNKR